MKKLVIFVLLSVFLFTSVFAVAAFAVTPQIAAGPYHTVGLKNDGTVVATGLNVYGQCNVSSWTDIIQISVGPYHTVGLKSDGTVVAVGDNAYGQCNVGGWSNIVQVVSNGSNTVGLKSDGTVVAVGDNAYGQCNVGGWNDIVKISVGPYHTVGLKSDGTVVAVGRSDAGQCDVADWRDIVDISAGGIHTVGLKSDGTVVAAGNNYDGKCNVAGWSNIVQIAASRWHTVGLKSDGTVVAVGNNGTGRCDVDGWSDIVKIYAADDRTIGLKNNGTVMAAGLNTYGQCDVADWNNIIGISVAENHTAGLKSDGIVMVAGENDYGQLNVGDWNLGIVFDFSFLYNYSWFDSAGIPQYDRESIYTLIWNCIGHPTYTYEYCQPGGCQTYVDHYDNYWINENYSLQNLPVAHVNGQIFFTPWLDASWENLITTYDDSENKFNTVYAGNPQADEKFEVISHIDEAAPPSGTDNVRSYFFTYRPKTDNNGTATTMDEWIDYLRGITEQYGRTIDTLTIFAHGIPGEIQMSEAFHFKNNAETQRGMERLWDENILSPCGTILIFSCDVGQDQQFIQNLADWSGATVYANSVRTGRGSYSIQCNTGSCVLSADWDLDVVKVPANYTPCQDVLNAPLRADSDITFMFPGGIAVQITKDSLDSDGEMIVTNTLEHLAELGIDTSGKDFLAAYDISLTGTVIKDQMFMQITLPLSSNLGGLDASDIKVQYWDEQLEQWSQTGIFDVQINEQDHSVTFKTNHATIFAVFVENYPPVALCHDVTVTAEPGADTASVSIDAGSYDPDGDFITIEQIPPGPYAIGTTDADLTVTDDKGLSGVCTATVTVEAAPVVHCGDANSDGAVNGKDLLFKLKETNDKFKAWQNGCWRPRLPCGDFDGNGKIDRKDPIKKYAALMQEYYNWYNDCWKSR
ncbi:hypothetical protein A2303_00110 [Candidatus Falkowbacteria bacterium RIFOXYB2_FULL_47_14]|uniref:HYR domain-containing protein n=1 Tax=Candidatus Falkowbacteria bacterium RIFOXYA2_FULL_47_19 TaxID=1797994 RepID=A0A1F5SN25_9BACT|nr:MAG: hypothetical protein A2227_01390 [Candidatus Falkowbacteria bacterium RIFOXYA2_FULL_47_19]OGF36816.1 MAG: hypothetical protein A2468_03375 [Candidatus Falkowbacteria bacterium RIFOXYC2_FULL_46_15]OGF44058.1 MAG: hypothetical protein A2303_00110 [Candidatus Falkowbacteria bacterium RIFOXYB2_FULL_47_14]